MGKLIIILLLVFPLVGLCQNDWSFYKGNTSCIIKKSDGTFYLTETYHAGVSIFSSGKWKDLGDSSIQFVSDLHPEKINMVKENDSLFTFRYEDFHNVFENIKIPLAFYYGDSCNIKNCIPRAKFELQFSDDNKMGLDSVSVNFLNLENIINVLPNKYSKYLAKDICDVFIRFDENERLRIKEKTMTFNVPQPIKNICITIRPDTINYIYAIGQDVNLVCDLVGGKRVKGVNIEIDRQILDFSEFVPIESVFKAGEDYLKVEHTDMSIVFRKVDPDKIHTSCISGMVF